MAPTVALGGATGNLGPSVLKALLDADLKVTILSRKGSKSTDSLPSHPNQTITKVDFTDPDDVANALKGIDVAVSILGSNAIGDQKPYIDAALKAGVKRFIPSEFGSDTARSDNAQLPVFQGKVETAKYLEELASSNPGFSYTRVVNNCFFDWGLKHNFLMKINEHKAILYDGGDVPFSTTTLASVGKGVVGVIMHLDETKNKVVYIHDTVTTINKIISTAKGIDGKDWETETKSTDEVLQSGMDELKKDKPDIGSAMFAFLYKAIFGKERGPDFTGKVSNELFGMPVMSEQQVSDVIKANL